MHIINLSRVDLNLFVVFDAVMQERHVGRAADRLSLTQPAVSHALRRLRDVVNDPLFVRHARGVKPTARAEVLAGSIAPALALLKTGLGPRDGFTASTVKRTVVVGTSDFIELTLLPRVVAKLRQEAPLLDLRIKPITRASVAADLRRRDIDLAVGPMSAAPDAVELTPLFKERFVMIARRGHPALRKSLTPKRFALLPHLLISPQGDPFGVVDHALRELGLKRRIALTLAHFVAAPLIIASTDLVATLPERVASRMRSVAAIGVRDVPVDIPPWTVGLAQAKESLGDPLLEWLSKLIGATAADD